MSTRHVTRNEVAADEQAYENIEGFDEGPALRPSVEMEIRAKVDANHPDGLVQDYSHLTLAQEEMIRAREAELAHISEQARLGLQEGRAERTREIIVEECRERWEARRKPDPRERLAPEKLEEVNREASRIVERIGGGVGHAGVARTLAVRVLSGEELIDAVFATLEEMKRSSGVILPIAEVPAVAVSEVSVEGEVIQLWKPSTHVIQQVGLIADETSKIKFTVWKRSHQTMVREGDRVRFHAVKKNWYRGRCSIALTYQSRIRFVE